jgi:hypothetical protein
MIFEKVESLIVEQVDGELIDASVVESFKLCVYLFL